MEAVTTQSVSRLAFRWLRMVARLPHADSNELTEVIKNGATCRWASGRQVASVDNAVIENDVRELERGGQSGLIFVVLVTTILYSIKCLLIVIKSLIIIGNSDIRADKFQQASPEVHFSCMTTNCSWLSYDASLQEDLAKLPLFAICDPLAYLYPVPHTYLDRMGLAMYLVLGLSTLINGILIPCHQLISAHPNECSLFVQAPQLAIALARLRLASRASKLSAATSATASPCTADRETSGALLSRTSGLQSSTLNDGRTLIENLSYARDSSGAKGAARNRHHAGELPVTRSRWFHGKITKATCWQLSTIAVFALVCSYITYDFLNTQIDNKMREFELFAGQIRQQECAIWVSGKQEVIRMDQFDMSWSFWGLLECFGPQLLPTFIACLSFDLLYLNILELNCHQAELQNQLMFLIELRRQIVATSELYGASDKAKLRPIRSCCLCQSQSFSLKQQQQQAAGIALADMAMKSLTRRFQEANKYCIYLLRSHLIHQRSSLSVGGPLSKPTRLGSRLDSTLAFQDLAMRVLQMIRRHNCLAASELNRSTALVEPKLVNLLLMERVYLNFSLYLDLMRHHTPSLAIIISISYFLLCGVTLIAVLYLKIISVDGTVDGLMMAVGFVWLLTNYVLLVCSAVHAKGKSLHKLIWSLIAQFEGSEDHRALYWLDRWRLQVIRLDSEGGIALQTLGFKVTYVRIIQLVIWAATLVVFVVQR